MMHDSLEWVIDRANDGAAPDKVYIRPLQGNVSIARVWLQDPSDCCGTERGYEFYLVYEAEVCAAAFLNMGPGNFHVFTKESFRRRGIMSSAMTNVILPHLFRESEHMEQRVEYESEASKRLLEKTGFSILNEQWAVIRKGQCASVEFAQPPEIMLSEMRMKALRKRFAYMAGLLEMARFELDRVSPDFCEKLSYLQDELRNCSGEVEDRWWAQKERLGIR